MNRITAIANRDALATLNSRRGLTLLTITAVSWVFYFFNLLTRFQHLVTRAVGMEVSEQFRLPTVQAFIIAPYFEFILLTLAILVPLLAMTTFSADRHSGAIELLLTSPIRRSSLIGGRFIGLIIQVISILLLGSLLPLIFAYLSQFDEGVVASSILGALVAGIALSAVALAASVWATSQLHAAITAIAINIVLLLIHTPAQVVSPSFGPVLVMLSIFTHFETFIDGYVSLAAILYFTVLTTLALYIARAGIDHSELSTGDRQNSQLDVFWISLIFISTATVLFLVSPEANRVLAVVELIIGISLLLFTLVSVANKAGRRLFRGVLWLIAGVLFFISAYKANSFYDLSADNRNTLAPITVSRLEQLPSPVSAKYFLQGDRELDRRAMKLLRNMAAKSNGRFYWEAIDPTRSADVGMMYGVRFGDRLQIVVGGGSASERRVQLQDLSEQSVVAALSDLFSTDRGRIVFLDVGAAASAVRDGGRTGLSAFVSSLRTEGLEITISSVEQLADTSALGVAVLVAPQRELSAYEGQIIEQYIERGGKLFIAVDPLYSGAVSGLMERFEIDLSAGMVIDSNQMALSSGQAGLQPLISDFAQHPITNRLGRARAMIMNIATPVRFSLADSDVDRGRKYFELAWASPGSVIEPDPLDILTGKRALVGAGRVPDRPIAVVLGMELNDQPSMVVFGDSDWLQNSAFELYSNRDIAHNSIQWLLGNSWALTSRTTNAVSSLGGLSAVALSNFLLWSLIVLQGVYLIGLFRLYYRSR